MAPLVVKNKVLVGEAAEKSGVRGWVKALDTSDGKVVWTAYRYRSGQRRAHRPKFQAVLLAIQRTGSGRQVVAARCVEDRGRRHVGMDLLRSRTQPDLSRQRQSRAVECRRAARRELLDFRHIRARRWIPARRSGFTSSARTISTTTTASTRTCFSICRSTASRARCWFILIATATCT